MTNKKMEKNTKKKLQKKLSQTVPRLQLLIFLFLFNSIFSFKIKKGKINKKNKQNNYENPQSLFVKPKLHSHKNKKQNKKCANSLINIIVVKYTTRKQLYGPLAICYKKKIVFRFLILFFFNMIFFLLAQNQPN